MSNVRQATMTWVHGLVFDGGAPGGPAIRLDGNGGEAPSPVVALLLAAAACSGADVVSILEKSRAGLTSCRIEVSGIRAEDHPRRFLSIHMVFYLAGSALDEARARRAIDLSLEKYCSVVHSLARDIVLTHELVLG